jgi:hypothetical protein
MVIWKMIYVHEKSEFRIPSAISLIQAFHYCQCHSRRLSALPGGDPDRHAFPPNCVCSAAGPFRRDFLLGLPWYV